VIKLNNIIKKAIKNICVKASEFACGTASTNYTYQPKEPKNIKNVIKKK
jgi:cyclic lactone autoinducer peptide